MNELTALLILGLMALAYHVTNDEPWTGIERRVNQAVVALAHLGWMVERALACHPLIEEGARYLDLDNDTWDNRRTLGDELEAFDSSQWKAERFEGSVVAFGDSDEARASHRHWFGVERDPIRKGYRVRVFYILRDGRGGHEFGKAGLLGEDLERLLRTFAGCTFSPAELAQVESRWAG